MSSNVRPPRTQTRRRNDCIRLLSRDTAPVLHNRPVQTKPKMLHSFTYLFWIRKSKKIRDLSSSSGLNATIVAICSVGNIVYAPKTNYCQVSLFDDDGIVEVFGRTWWRHTRKPLRWRNVWHTTTCCGMFDSIHTFSLSRVYEKELRFFINYTV